MTAPLVVGLPPVLPIERLSVRANLASVYEDGTQVRAHRMYHDTTVARGKPDIILLSAHHDRVSADISLTPGMVVHLANTMLTDAERGRINALGDVRVENPSDEKAPSLPLGDDVLRTDEFTTLDGVVYLTPLFYLRRRPAAYREAEA